MGIKLAKIVRFILLVALLGGTTMVAAAAQQTAVPIIVSPQDEDETPYVNEAAYPLLQLTVAPTNQAGIPFTQLAATDFTIREGDAAAAPVAVEGGYDPQQPVSIMLVLDVSGPMAPLLGDLRTAVSTLYTHLEQTDQSGIIAFDTAVNLGEPFPQLNPQRELNFTSDEGALINLLNSLTAGEGSGTPLYDAALKGIRLANNAATADRKAVILLTNGSDQNSEQTASGSSVATAETVVQAAQAGGIPLFVLGIGNQVNSDLEPLTRATNGAFYPLASSGEVGATLEQLVRQLKHTYQLSYQAQTVSDDALHELHIATQTPQGIAETTVSFRARHPLVPAVREVALVTETGDSFLASEGLPALLGEVTLTPTIVSRSPLTAVQYLLDGNLVFTATAPPWLFVWSTYDYANTEAHTITIEPITTTSESTKHDIAILLQPCASLCRVEQLLGFPIAYLFLGLGSLILLIFFVLLRQRRTSSPAPPASAFAPPPAKVYNPTVISKQDKGYSTPTELDPLLTEYDDEEMFAQEDMDLAYHTSYTRLNDEVDTEPEEGRKRPFLPKTELLPRLPQLRATLHDTETQQTYQLTVINNIGRAPDNHIIIAEPAVSAHHARISVAADNFVIEDLGATNPTQVNNHDIKKHILADGDTITIGRHTFRFQQATQE